MVFGLQDQTESRKDRLKRRKRILETLGKKKTDGIEKTRRIEIYNRGGMGCLLKVMPCAEYDTQMPST